MITARTLMDATRVTSRLGLVTCGSRILTRFSSSLNPIKPIAVEAVNALREKAANKQKHIVVALGGNALLQRGQPMTIDNQKKNVADGISSLRKILEDNTITLVHGNGPQVGLLSLQEGMYHKKTGDKEAPLDVLDAETEGMIGYLLEQEIYSHLVATDNSKDRGVATVLSQILVDPKDPAFQKPTKFIGPIYTDEEVKDLNLLQQGEYYTSKDNDYYKRDGNFIRRVVPSPLPVKLLDPEMNAVRLLTDQNCIVICGGGGGIPVYEDPLTKQLVGVEAVIDKDRAATMLGTTLGADGLMILTDVRGCATDYGTPNEKWIKSTSTHQIERLMLKNKDCFPSGSMGPKVESAIQFVTTSTTSTNCDNNNSTMDTEESPWCTIGSLKEADKMISREAGTLITNEFGPDHIEYYDNSSIDNSHIDNNEQHLA